MVAGKRSGLVEDEDEDEDEDEAHPHLSQPRARASEQRQACDMDGLQCSRLKVGTATKYFGGTMRQSSWRRIGGQP